MTVHTWWNALPVQLSDLCQETIVHMLHKAWYAVEGAVTGLIQLGPAQQAVQAKCGIMPTVLNSHAWGGIACCSSIKRPPSLERLRQKRGSYSLKQSRQAHACASLSHL
jgi:hypothetical protein